MNEKRINFCDQYAVLHVATERNILLFRIDVIKKSKKSGEKLVGTAKKRLRYITNSLSKFNSSKKIHWHEVESMHPCQN